MECKQKLLAEGATSVSRTCQRCGKGPCLAGYNTSKHGVIVENSYTQEDDYNKNMYYTHTYKEFIEFPNEKELMDWIRKNESMKIKVIKYIRFNELKLNKEITLTLT